jgi:hypothetical protein
MFYILLEKEMVELRGFSLNTFAESIGYRVDFSDVSESDMIEASATSFLCDYRKMNEIFLNNTIKIVNDEE